MSGLEIVGVIASTLQLAEIGMKLSVKLCSFYRQIKNADHSAQHLASDVSLTCSILNQLGKALEKDRETRLCSHQAFLTAKEVLDECDRIFKQIEEAMERQNPSSGKSKWNRGARRLTIVMLGPDLDLLKAQLDRLKSTMLLMLNVIMYAREINQMSDHSSLKNQRLLIEKLIQEKTEIEAKFNGLLKMTSSLSDSKKEFPSSTAVVQSDMRSFQQFSTKNEIDKYYNLIKSLLIEIDASQSTLQQDRHLRIRDGMVNIHTVELALFRESHGKEVVRNFENSLFKPSNWHSSLVSKGKTPSKEQYMEGKDKLYNNALRSGLSSPISETQSNREKGKAQIETKESDGISAVQHGGRRTHKCTNLRSRSGIVQIPSPSMDPYEPPRGHFDYDDNYPSDVGYGSHDYQPRRRSTVDIQPTSQNTYRDAGSHKRRTEYAFQPRGQIAHRSRSNTASTRGQYDTPQSPVVLPGSHIVPVTPAEQVDSSLLSDSGHVVHSPFRHGHHRQVYSSTEYASDTGRLDPQDSGRRRSSYVHRAQPQSGRRRYPADAYSYTSPREQFDQDYPVKPRRPTRTSLDRPLSMNVTDEHSQYLPGKEHQDSHVLTSWESYKIDSEGYRRKSSRSSNDPQTRAKSQTRDISPTQDDNDSESQMYTDDDDLRKYRRESYAIPCRWTSSADPNSTDEQSQGQEDRFHRRSSWSQRSQPMVGDADSRESCHSPESRDDVRKPISVDPPVLERPQTAPKAILKPPRESFPEKPNPIKEGIAPLKDANKTGIPPVMRWTNIDRRLVNPEALDAGNERYRKRTGYIIVLRVLSKDEIQMYAVKTREIRENRRRREENQRRGHRGEESSSEDEDNEDVEPLKIEAPPSNPEPEKTDESGGQSMGFDPPSSNQKPSGNSEGNNGRDTLEDLVLSWTNLSREMIQL